MAVSDVAGAPGARTTAQPRSSSARWEVRDGQVRNKPFYIVLGVTVNGERDILGIWAGDGGEGAKY